MNNFMCPVFQINCIEDKCVSYEVHTKQRFRNIKTNKYITVDQLGFYALMSPVEKEQTIERTVTVIKECKQLGKIISIETTTDHLVPNLA